MPTLRGFRSENHDYKSFFRVAGYVRTYISGSRCAWWQKTTNTHTHTHTHTHTYTIDITLHVLYLCAHTHTGQKQQPSLRACAPRINEHTYIVHDTHTHLQFGLLLLKFQPHSRTMVIEYNNNYYYKLFIVAIAEWVYVPMQQFYYWTITRTMQGIPLAFRPPTVCCLRYCAAEVMTNYTQFCIVQPLESFIFASCALTSLMAVVPRETCAVCTLKINWGEPERAPH